MNSSALDPNLAGVTDFLTTIFGDCAAGSGLIEINYDALDPADGQWKLNRWRRFPVENIQAAARLAVKVSRMEGARVYCGMGLRRADLHANARSTNSDIVAWPAAVWDFDNMEVAEEGLDAANALGLDFHFVTVTGAIRNATPENPEGEDDLRIQCWAKFNTPVTDPDLIKQIQLAGIRALGSDKSIHDARRVMRVCGTIAFARKDGRVDEMTYRDREYENLAARYDPQALLTLLRGADPAPSKPVSEESITRLRETLDASGGVGQMWAGAPSATAFLADLLNGVEMNPSLFHLAQMAARRGHSAGMIQAALSGLLDASSAQTSRPDRAEQLYGQLKDIVKRAVTDAGGEGAPPPESPAEDFDSSEPPPEAPNDPHTAMFRDCVYVRNTGEVFDTRSRGLFEKGGFNADRSDVGIAASGTRGAYAIFINENATDNPRDPGRRRVADAAAYMPNTAPVYSVGGMTYVNPWTPSRDLELPGSVADEDVAIWADHVRYICNGDSTAEHVFTWMAFTLQRPEMKINHALLIKSRHHGIGKNLLLPPLQRGLGEHNCQAISGDDLIDGWSSYLENKKLITVDELATADRRDTAQKLKTFLATAPGGMLSVRKKHVNAFEVPNIVQMIFFSNLDNPIIIEESDRRFFVVDSEAEPREVEYYERLAAFYEQGGKEKVVRWLLQRDVSDFKYAGPAPITTAKEEMISLSLSGPDAWVHEGLQDREGIFARDLVALIEVHNQLPREMSSKITRRRLGALLRRAGAEPLTERIWLAELGKQTEIWALRPTKEVKSRSVEMNLVAWKKEYKTATAVNGRDRGFA